MIFQMEIVVRTGGVRDPPNRQHRGQSILLGFNHAEPQAQVHLRTGDTDRDRSAASTFGAFKPRRYARPRHVSFDERSLKLAFSAVGALGAFG